MKDHPGYPSTPGLRAAVARMTAAHDEHARRADERRRRTIRAAMMARIGEDLLATIATMGDDVLPDGFAERLREAAA